MTTLTRMMGTLMGMMLAGTACSEVAPPQQDDTALAAPESRSEVRESAPPPACHANQPWPYPAGNPHVGVHAGPGNNDVVACTLAEHYTEEWHVLQGRAIAQPNTFSPDGLVTYVTTTQPEPGDCTVHALSTATGEALWCRAYDDGALWSSIEVDEKGMLYFTTGDAIISLKADGSERWSVSTPRHPGGPNGAIGLHFTPDGHIATVTNQGAVLLLSRESGAILASLDIQETFGFMAPATASFGISLVDLMPAAILEDFASFQDGDPGVLLGVFTGEGNFSDNTIGIAPNGDLYVVGGGPESDNGAMVQIRVDGTAEAPILTPGWHVPFLERSACSPAISPDGRFVKLADGNSTFNFLNPENAVATMRIVDIPECDANTDDDPDPGTCAPTMNIPLATGPIMGTTPMLSDGIHYVYELQFSHLLDDASPDLRAFAGEEVLWELNLPDQLQWSSVITVTDEHLVGTATAFTPSEDSIFTVELPGTAKSELVIIHRNTGKLVFRAPITDDSTSTVTVGPDRALYVTLLTLLHTMSIDTHPIAGMIRFSPTEEREIRANRAP